MKRRKVLAIALVTLLNIFLHNNASAELKIGNLKIYPEIGLEETYRSNIYQTERGTKSDFITSVLPAIRARYSFGGNHSLNLGYSGAWKNYANYSENNYWDNRAWGNLSLHFPGGLDVGIEHRYTNSWIERSAFVDYQRHYVENVTGAIATYGFADRWKAQLQYTRDDYARSSSSERVYSYVSDLYGGSIFYRFTARTSGLIEYQHINKSFDRSGTFDSTVHQSFLGLNFDPAGKLTGWSKLGYGWKEFNRNIANRSSRSYTWVADVNLVQHFTTYTNLGLSGVRTFQDDSVYANTSLYKTAAALTLQHYLTSKVGRTCEKIAYSSVVESQLCF